MSAVPVIDQPTGGRFLRAASDALPGLRQGLVTSMLLAVVGTLGHVAVPVLVQQVIDGELLDPTRIDVARVGIHVAVAAAILTGATVARGAAMARLTVATAEALSALRVRVFRHLHDRSILHLQSERRGALVSRVTSDVDSMQEFMEWGGVSILVGATQISLTLAAMLVYRWQLALLVLAASVAYALLLQWFQRILAKAHDGVRERVSESLTVVGEAVAGLPTVRAYGAEERVRGRVARALARQFDAEYRTGRLGAILYSSAEVYAGAITAGIVGVGVLWEGLDVSAGTLVAFLFLTTLFLDPVQNVVEILNEAQAAGAGLRRVLDVLAVPPEVTDPVGDGTPLPSGPLSIDLDHVGFRYPDGVRDVLHDIVLHIPAGAKVVLVGATGSGKTTLAKLIVRIADASAGAVRIGGVDVREVPLADLRRRVAYVPQEGFLFAGTVADNLRAGAGGRRGDGELEEALAALGLGPWLASLPDGLATPVGERGARLSSGERQLVALARAWLVGADVLVMDEATSSVDPKLEVVLRRALTTLTAGRTSVTVAHRLSTAEHADEVVVLDEGRLVERGSHAQLLAAGGHYAGFHADWTRHTRVG